MQKPNIFNRKQQLSILQENIYFNSIFFLYFSAFTLANVGKLIIGIKETNMIH